MSKPTNATPGRADANCRPCEAADTIERLAKIEQRAKMILESCSYEGHAVVVRYILEGDQQEPEVGVSCEDCGKRITDPREVVIKGDRAMHFNCPAR